MFDTYSEFGDYHYELILPLGFHAIVVYRSEDQPNDENELLIPHGDIFNLLDINQQIVVYPNSGSPVIQNRTQMLLIEEPSDVSLQIKASSCASRGSR